MRYNFDRKTGARWFALVGALVAALVAAPALAQSAVTFETDKDTYIYPTDVVARVTVSGLDSCAGEAVAFGFMQDGDPAIQVPSSVVTATLAQDGSATADIPLPTSAFYDMWPNVVGDCVPGGAVASEQPVTVLHGDPTQEPGESPTPEPTPETATPKPPATGAGSGQAVAPQPGQPWALLFGAVALTGALGLARFALRKRL